MSEQKSIVSNQMLEQQTNKKSQSNREESETTPSAFQLPKITKIRETIRELMQKKLDFMVYDNDIVQNTAKDFSELIKNSLKEKKLGRYKFIVQTIIGEQKNQGVQLVNKCFWDASTDMFITEQFQNDHIFCIVLVYALYVY
jgi:hypothetical protein